MYRQDKGQRSSCVVDVTTTRVSTASDNMLSTTRRRLLHAHMKHPASRQQRHPGQTRPNVRVTIVDVNVANFNCQQHVPIGVEMDSLALGNSGRSFTDRLTRQRDGQEHRARCGRQTALRLLTVHVEYSHGIGQQRSSRQSLVLGKATCVREHQDEHR